MFGDIFIRVLNSGGSASQSNLIAIIVAVIAACAAIIAAIISAYFSYKASTKSSKASGEVNKEVANMNNEVNKKIANVSAEIQKEIASINVNALDKQRINETISIQRMEWVNKLRDMFVIFNKITHTYSMVKFTHYFKGIDFKTKIDDYQEIISAQDNIKLLLNPNEWTSIKLEETMEKLVLNLINQDTNKKEYDELRQKIQYLEQVILKAEWKRTVREIEEGRPLNRIEVEKIFEDCAINISEELFLELNIEQ